MKERGAVISERLGGATTDDMCYILLRKGIDYAVNYSRYQITKYPDEERFWQKVIDSVTGIADAAVLPASEIKDTNERITKALDEMGDYLKTHTVLQFVLCAIVENELTDDKASQMYLSVDSRDLEELPKMVEKLYTIILNNLNNKLNG